MKPSLLAMNYDSIFEESFTLAYFACLIGWRHSFHPWFLRSPLLVAWFVEYYVALSACRLHAALFAGNRIDKVKMHSKLTSFFSYVVSEKWSFACFVGWQFGAQWSLLFWSEIADIRNTIVNCDESKSILFYPKNITLLSCQEGVARKSGKCEIDCAI